MIRRIWQWLRRILFFVFVLAVFLLAAVAIVLNTESGSRFALNRIAAAVPGTLEFEGVEGTLWRTLDMRSLRYRVAELELTSNELELVISWPSVLAGGFTLIRLDAGDIVYRSFAPADPVAAPLEIAMAPLPLTIGIEEANVNSFRLINESSDILVERIFIGDAVGFGTSIEFDAGRATFDDIELSILFARADLKDDVPVYADISWQQSDGAWSGEGSVAGSLDEMLVSHSLTNPHAVTASGVLRLLGRIEPEFELDVDWQRWPLGEAEFRDGSVNIRGTTGNYDTELRFSLSEPRVPDAMISGTATGNTEGFSTADFIIQSASGNAAIAGAFGWLPGPTAAVSVELDNLDPGVITERLSGLIFASARFDMAAPDSWSLSGMNISGTLNDSDLVATANLAMMPDEFRCGDCRVLLGGNSLVADGTFGDTRIAMDIRLEAPDLRAVWEDTDGRLSVDGRLGGNARQPRFTGTVEGTGLRYDLWEAEAIAVDSRGSGTDVIDLTLSVTTLKRAGSDIGSLEGIISGAPDKLEVDIEWAFLDIAADASGSVMQTDDGFNSTVTRASITEPYAGRWILAAPVSVSQGSAGLEIGSHRWLPPNGMLEVTQFRYSADEVALTGSLSDLPLAIANSFLPDDYRLGGSVNANVDVARRNAEWLGTIDWQQADTVVRVARPGEEVFDLRIPEARVDASLANGGADIESNLRIEPGVSVGMTLGMERLSSDSPINAELRIDGEEWEWLSSLVPAIDNFGGDVSVNVAATGPLLAPELSGEASWVNGSVAVPALNVPLTDINVTASGASAGTATVRGSARAGDGELGITGRFEDVMLATRRVEITLTGQTAELVNWPEYRLWVTPDVSIQGSSMGWALSGSVDLPKAEIAVRQLPEGAVSVSPDVRTTADVPEPQTITRYSGEVRVTIQDGVHVSAFGLDTKLNGELMLRKQPDKELSAEGRVNLVEGVFVAYGQRLSIQEGTLTFTGPLDDPIVDVRAVRVIENFDETITAGLHLRGRAKNLTSSVYSEPVMSEADALSYLIIGRPLSEATNAEGGQLSGAAVGLGLRQASRITQQIGQSLGLDQLGFTGDGGDGTALVAGKQISSRLYARYAYGVFSRLGMILIRYRLTDRFSLEAGAGENQSIDILYSVETQ